MTDTLKDLIDRRGVLRGLLLHPGWKVLCEEALKERENLLAVFETPVADIGGALAQEFSKGRAYQLRMLAGAPAAIIDNLTIDIQFMQQETGDDRSDESELDAHADDSDSGERAP